MARRSDHSRKELTKLALESARQIVAEEGIDGLSGRKVTRKIGYTIGTLYQLFEDMDDLVERMNVQTLQRLYAHCQIDQSLDEVDEQLKELGQRFIEYVTMHPNEWYAVMSYRYKDNHTVSDAYNGAIQKLFGLMERVTLPLYADDERQEQSLDMALLWTSLTGLLGIAASERKLAGGSIEEMTERLIKMYLASRPPIASGTIG